MPPPDCALEMIVSYLCRHAGQTRPTAATSHIASSFHIIMATYAQSPHPRRDLPPLRCDERTMTAPTLSFTGRRVGAADAVAGSMLLIIGTYLCPLDNT